MRTRATNPVPLSLPRQRIHSLERLMLVRTEEQGTCHRPPPAPKESRGHNPGKPEAAVRSCLVAARRRHPPAGWSWPEIPDLIRGGLLVVRGAGLRPPGGGGRQGRRHHLQERRPNHLRDKETRSGKPSKSAPIRWGRSGCTGARWRPWRARASSRCRSRAAIQYYGSLRCGGGRRGDGGRRRAATSRRWRCRTSSG